MRPRTFRRRIAAPINLVLLALALLTMAYIFAWPLAEHGALMREAETLYDRLQIPPLGGLIRTRAMEAMIVAWFFMLGGTIGSFLNVVAHRMPRGQSIVWRPSRCPYCATSIRASDNIPVFGWIKIRGRCRACRLPVSPRYPIVELIMALVFVSLLVFELAPAHSPQLHASPSESALVTIVLNPLWSAVGRYTAHCVLLALLLVWTLMEIDGHSPPTRTLLFALSAGAAAAVGAPALAAADGAVLAASFLRERATEAALGVAGGLWLSGVLLLCRPSADPRPRRMAALAGGATTGLFLGWALAVSAALVAAALQLTTAFLYPFLGRRQGAALAGVLFAAVWLLLCAWPALPGALVHDLILDNRIQLAAALAAICALALALAFLAGWAQLRKGF